MNQFDFNFDNWFNSQKEKDEKKFKKIAELIKNKSIDHIEFKDKLLEITDDWNQIFEVFNFYNLKEWDRKDIYNFVRYIQFNYEFTEEKHDFLGDVLGNLSGFCSLEKIIKLANEPNSNEEFGNYFSKIDFSAL